jgi:hypothetical protein
MKNLDAIFEAVYKKYYTKDYFGTRAIVRSKLAYAKGFNANVGEKRIVYTMNQIKMFLLNEKTKAYNMMLTRIEEKKAGKIFPKREKFTWEIFNKMGI